MEKSYIMNEKNEQLRTGLRQYADRMRQIRFLSSPGLEGLKTAEAYSYVLRENFKNIGKLAEENRSFINDTLTPLLSSLEPLDDETVEAIKIINEELLNATDVESIDLPIASLLADRLSEDAERKDEQDYMIEMLDKEIETSYLLINMTKRITSFGQIAESFRRKGLDALDTLLGYLDKDKFLTLSMDSREIVLIDSRYGAALYENMASDESNLILDSIDILENALEISRDPFYHEAVKDFDWRYHIFRIYEYLSLTDTVNQDPETRKKIADYSKIIFDLWLSDPDYYREFTEYTEIDGQKLKNDYLAGYISKEEYKKRTYDNYLNRDPDKYNVEGYFSNITFPADYISFLKEDDLTEEEIRKVDDIYRSALSYIFRIPKMGFLSGTLEYYARMIYDFREFPGTISFEEMGLRSLAALHPPTYIHSQMVARISRCMAGHLFSMKPELFKDLCPYLIEAGRTCSVSEDDKAQEEMIKDYTYHAGLCHDFGKIMIIDTILVYGRRLLDFEFDLIKSHPQMGASLLSKHESTRLYADVARGHHLWYDCSRGYPADFLTGDSPLKTIIDIVAVADCMDAATDTVGRSYNKGKTLDDYILEVEQDAGTRYAPWAPDLLKEPEVKKDLEYLLEKERLKIYGETYSLLRDVKSVE